jgi:hypothetical protein
MGLWTAASDVDYDTECGNGDLWDNSDRAEFEAWLEDSGFFSMPEDEAWEEFLRQRWEMSVPVSNDVDVEEDDIAF